MYLTKMETILHCIPMEMWWVNGFGYALIKMVQLEIGGNTIDTQTIRMMDLEWARTKPEHEKYDRWLEIIILKLDCYHIPSKWIS